MANTYNDTIYQGATYKLSVTYKDNVGAAINLTGYTAKLMLKDSVGGPTTYLTLTESSGITITPLTGTLDIVMTAAQTAGFSFNTASYDLLITSGAGEKTRLIEGTFTLDKQVTV